MMFLIGDLFITAELLPQSLAWCMFVHVQVHTCVYEHVYIDLRKVADKYDFSLSFSLCLQSFFKGALLLPSLWPSQYPASVVGNACKVSVPWKWYVAKTIESLSFSRLCAYCTLRTQNPDHRIRSMCKCDIFNLNLLCSLLQCLQPALFIAPLTIPNGVFSLFILSDNCKTSVKYDNESGISKWNISSEYEKWVHRDSKKNVHLDFFTRLSC